MHKFAKELLGRIVDDYKGIGYENMTCDTWGNMEKATAVVKNIICADKDYAIKEAMEKAEEKEKMLKELGIDRMGYDRMDRERRRNPYGYNQMMSEDEYTRQWLRNPEMFEKNMRMGYRVSDRGADYEEYVAAKRHYTDTKDPEHKAEMERKADILWDNIERMVMDIVADRDPAKKQMDKQRMLKIAQMIQ